MSEIQNFNNFPDYFKYILVVAGFLFTACSALIVYIFRNLKKEIELIKLEMISKYKFVREKQSEDHDKLTGLISEHNINHRGDQ